MIGDWLAASFPVLPTFGDSKWIPKPQGQSVDSRERLDEAKNRRVIVIDDEALIAETVMEILNGEGFEAIAASSGASAIELAMTWEPDIVLSDVIMPGMNGVETGITIRELFPNCRIILFSGQAATVELLEKARHHRFQILAKPISPDQLISMIRDSSVEPS
jgi:CheY-like chemotaxis protein